MPNSSQQNAFNGAQSTGQGVIYDQLGNPRVVGAQMPTGASAGYVVTSDAAGNLTLAAPAAASLPLTTLGDTLYEDATPTPVRLAGNTTATKNFLTQTGTGAVSAAPAWGTIAAGDLPTGTTSTKGALQLDGTAGDIQPTSTAAAAGSAGKAADAGHVHAQNYGGLFGDGSDGTVTFDGSTTILGLVPSSQIYTMNRDIFCTGITINNGVTVKPNGWRIFCAGTVTSNGTIANNGGNASGTNNGTGGTASGNNILAGNSGASGVTGVGATGGGNGTMFGTGTGNNGGSGTSGAGGGNHAQRTGISPLRSVAHILAATAGWQGSPLAVSGAGGGGSGSGDGTNVGGGGGGGGGVVAIIAWAVNNGSGTINANGGNGGSPGTTTGGCGGGGGGGGGLILVYTLTAWTAGTTTVAGGNAGTGAGTGANGTAGTSGTVLNVVVQ